VCTIRSASVQADVGRRLGPDVAGLEVNAGSRCPSGLDRTLDGHGSDIIESDDFGLVPWVPDFSGGGGEQAMPTPPPEILGRLLREIRERQGFAIEDLAAASDVASPRSARWNAA
jgi:hypothetical protein